MPMHRALNMKDRLPVVCFLCVCVCVHLCPRNLFGSFTFKFQFVTVLIAVAVHIMV